MKKVLTLSILTAAVMLVASQVNAGQDKTAKVKYGKVYTQVQAVFDKNCVGCHGDRGRGRINLTSYATLMKGGEDGPIVKPGDPAKSPLVQAIKHASGVRAMPPGRELSAADIKLVEGWVKAGAKPSK